jgi:sulfite reductase alpha subunit-like flavoprotein
MTGADACQVELAQHALIVAVVSTTGQGELPTNAQRFWKAMRSVRLRPGCLESVKFASFGLGDSSYPKYVPKW